MRRRREEEDDDEGAAAGGGGVCACVISAIWLLSTHHSPTPYQHVAVHCTIRRVSRSQLNPSPSFRRGFWTDRFT
jgi:hypothetical protein